MRELTVLFYGDAWRFSGAWSYVTALRNAGHTVIEVSDRMERPSSPLDRAYEYTLRFPRERVRRAHVEGIVDVAKRTLPDLIIVMRGLAIGPDDVRRLQAFAGQVINVNHDDFFSHYPTNWSVLQRDAIPVYDRLFVTKEVNVAETRARGGRPEFLPFAYDPSIHRPVASEDDEHLDSDVTFIGTYVEERLPLLERLVTRVPASYAFRGAGWDRLPARSPLRPYVIPAPVFGPEMAKVIGRASVSLGLLRRGNRDDHTQRTFEIPACGGVFLGERTWRHAAYFREGVECELFDPNDPAELAAKVRLLLTDPGRRESIRSAGLAAVRAQHHTYDDRVAQIVSAYDRDRR